MADNLTVKVQGGEEIIKALQALGLDMQRSLEVICTAGAEVMRDEIAATAPGSIGDEVVVQTKAKTQKRVTVEAGPSKAKWYGRFLERGTVPHNLTPKESNVLRMGPDSGIFFRKTAQHPGISAQPFMRPAFDTQQRAAQGEMADEAKKVVDRAGT